MRRTTFTLVAIVSFFLAPSLFLLAQQAKPKPAGTPDISEANPSTQEPSLRTEMELVRQYDERMQNTVYWALGVVVVLTVLLAGFSWYTNFRVYERDLNNLRGELRATAERETMLAKEQLGQLISGRLDDFSRTHEEFASEVQQQLQAVHDSTRDTAKSLDEEIVRSINWFRYDFLQLQITVREKFDEPKTTILRDYLSLLELGLELKASWITGLGLRSIEDLLRKGATLGSEAVERLTRALDSLPREFVPKGEVIRSLIPSAMAGI